ncbi:CGNR zinc finger domain-containing protein, partial [Nostoc sp. NIES-2111]
PRAGSLDLLGPAVALDFTNPSSGRGSLTHQEHLRCFDDVVDWAGHARVMLPADCAFVRTAMAGDGKGAARIFAQVLQARELIWRIGTALAERRLVPDELRQELGALHAQCLASADLELRDGAYVWTWNPRRGIVPAILGPVVLSALALLMERDLARTKRCEGRECGWLFFDTTKNRTRRWCEMKVCGNRAKVRASRQRKRPSR